MGENGARLGRTKLRLRGLIGGATVFGALGVALIMAMAPASAAGLGPNGFTKATWSPFHEVFGEGCTTAKIGKLNFSPKTGAGHFTTSTTGAKTCGKAEGGKTADSITEIEGEISSDVPVKLTSSNVGVSESWNIQAAGTTKATGGAAPTCTPTVYSGNDNFGYTWFNYSEAFALCDVESIVEIYGYSFLVDTTTNNEVASDYNYLITPIMENLSGNQIDWEAISYTYSNSSYWAYNYSGSYSYNSSWGPSGSVSATYTPTFYLNGTFTTGDKFMVETDIIMYLGAQVDDWTKGTASAVLNVGTSGNHVDLTSVTAY